MHFPKNIIQNVIYVLINTKSKKEITTITKVPSRTKRNKQTVTQRNLLTKNGHNYIRKSFPEASKSPPLLFHGIFSSKFRFSHASKTRCWDSIIADCVSYFLLDQYSS